MRILSRLFVFLIFVPGTTPAYPQEDNPVNRTEISDVKKDEMRWVDSVFNSLSFDERVAQLFMIRTYSNKDRLFYDSISRLIINYNIGGLTFFQGSPVRQAELINHWQHLAKTPLLISIDAEWGLAMRLDSVTPFPKHITLGAVQDDELIYKVGYQIGKQCHRAGIMMNFAPVIDINSNPKNPVINFRSFGEDKDNVAAKGVAFIKGMQAAGVIATAKHFPGHGDTDSDSHYTLPLLNHTFEQIDTTDVHPFRVAIENNVGAIMIAHLFIPAIDNTKNLATSLSPKAVNNLLKTRMAFEGLSITDALDMEGVTNYHKSGDIELMALLAGNDILLLPLNIPLALQKIRQAVADGKIDEEEINQRCRKVLTYKYQAGLADEIPVDLKNLSADLNTRNNDLVIRQVFEKAITIVKNDADLIPLTHLDTLKIASLVIGSSKISPFQERLEFYAPIDHFNLPSDPDKSSTDELLSKLEDYNLVIVGIENTSNYLSRNYGIKKSALEVIDKLKNHQGKLILDIFGSPYSLLYFNDHQWIDAIVLSYEDQPAAKDISAQIIFGAISGGGRLPVTASPSFRAGAGIDTHSIGRLKYTIPEEIGIPSSKLDTISRLIEQGIKKGAFPGCQVLFAKDGKVFYYKSFGYHTYEKLQPVKTDDLYDLASITKIAATTPAIMYLSDKGVFDIDMQLSGYLPYLINTNKEALVIREILAHQAMLKPWIPFYKNTIVDFKPDSTIYSNTLQPGYSTQVASEFYIHDNYRTILFDTIVKSALLKKKEFKYSDLGLILIYDAIEGITGQPFEDFSMNTFFKPMGLTTMGFNPAKRFPLHRITPTEWDTVFRKQLVHGFVHDPAAAMLGGVAGHSGLFADANDLAVIMQMFLQNGYYGGRQYIAPKTVKEFTRTQYPGESNRRGLGFDKPLPKYDSSGPTCQGATNQSYGHSGFTGTYAWADPSNGLLYIFLSNRVHPDANNRKISQLNLRTKLHQLMYDLLNENRSSAF
ncbi:MAG: serine hydrolase [Bacteroidales bacterium]|nr:serine hydrolase [Bacteroidales bacterium]